MVVIAMLGFAVLLLSSFGARNLIFVCTFLSLLLHFVQVIVLLRSSESSPMTLHLKQALPSGGMYEQILLKVDSSFGCGIAQ
ncbi:hypothetical protein BX070DRAFT_230580 [Coemansia spiralis]|nr:hypothetical protein BX070DRAFT_230580 [Coemansia spiralis]